MAGITKYERQLRSRLDDADQWPAFSSGTFLDRLEKIASRAMMNGTTEGCVAAILIYHQLVEEMLRLLIRDAQFLIQLAVFPSHIALHEKRKQVFGQLQQELRDLVDFGGKSRFLVKIDQINSIRIGIVHKLTQRGSLGELTRETRRANRLYDNAFGIFDQAHDDFRVTFHSYLRIFSNCIERAEVELPDFVYMISEPRPMNRPFSLPPDRS